jgi:hypothetical protein
MSDDMEIIYFVATVIFVTGLIYRLLHAHYRDRRKDRITDQIVRDRFEHDPMERL